MRNKGMSAPVEMPSGVRLRAARKMAGLSMDELVRRLGGIVTKQAIAKYESGQMRPSPEVLARLAEVLDIPPEIPGTIAMEAARPKELPAVRPDESRSREIVANRVVLSSRSPGPLARILHPRSKEIPTFRGRVLGKDDRVERAAMLEERGSGAEEPTLAIMDVGGLGRVLREEAPGPRPLDFSSVRFRERSPIPAKLESALRYTIADRMNRLMAVESMLGARVVFRNPLGGAPPPGTAEEVERTAGTVREIWGLGESPVPNLLGLLEEKGISVCEVGGFEEFDGLSAEFGSRTVIVVNPDVPADRVRFRAAHELAHVLGVAGAGPESAEGMCREFAGAFLLPRGPLARLMMPAGRKVALADLAELKRTYGVSLQAIMRRAHGLGLVTDRQMRRFREIFREKGWLETEPVEYRGAEKAVRFRRLLNFAVAEDILGLERAAALAGVAPEEFRKEMGEVF